MDRIWACCLKLLGFVESGTTSTYMPFGLQSLPSMPCSFDFHSGQDKSRWGKAPGAEYPLPCILYIILPPRPSTSPYERLT